MSFFRKQSFRERNRFNPGRWVMGDLHVHSTYSGGSLTPSELLMLAGAQLLEAVGIADHQRIDGAIEGERFRANHPGYPVVIAAQEVSLGDHFHLLAVGCRTGWGEAHRKQLVEKLKDHHDGGGAVILAHPWTVPKAGWAAECLRELLAENIIDAVEVFNASLLEFSDGEALLQPIWEDLVVPYRLAVTGGSDFHYHRQGRRLGSGRTYLKTNLPGAAGIIEALRGRRTVAGMFSYRPFDFGCFGAGYGALLGNEPWSVQFEGLVGNLQERLKKLAKWNPERRKALNRLMIGGHYQLVADLVGG